MDCPCVSKPCQCLAGSHGQQDTMRTRTETAALMSFKRGLTNQVSMRAATTATECRQHSLLRSFQPGIALQISSARRCMQQAPKSQVMVVGSLSMAQSVLAGAPGAFGQCLDGRRLQCSQPEHMAGCYLHQWQSDGAGPHCAADWQVTAGQNASSVLLPSLSCSS